MYVCIYVFIDMRMLRPRGFITSLRTQAGEHCAIGVRNTHVNSEVRIVGTHMQIPIAIPETETGIQTSNASITL